MAISNGFGITYSGLAVLDEYFGEWMNGEKIISMFLLCSGASGTLIYENALGLPQMAWIQTTQQKPIFCRRILTSAIINGVLQNTTATALYWDSSPSN